MVLFAVCADALSCWKIAYVLS